MRNIVRPISAFLAGVALLAGSMTGATPAAAQQGAALNTHDTLFAMAAALGNTEEIQLGLLATQFATDEQVRDFAQQMVEEHSVAQTQLLQLASAKGIALPEGLAAGNEQPLPQPEQEVSPDFDVTYMAGQVTAHAKAVDLYRRQASRGRDAELRQFAQANLPHVLQHLIEARSILTRLQRRTNQTNGRFTPIDNASNLADPSRGLPQPALG